MISVFGNCKKLSSKNLIIKLISFHLLSSKKSSKTDGCSLTSRKYASMPVYLCQGYNNQFFSPKYNLNSCLVEKRFFSKKKGSKQRVQEEESESDDEEYVETVNDDEVGNSLITKSVPSLRIDTVLKVGLGVTKKKIEQEFYALKLRKNGEKVVKKSLTVYSGDEVDRVKGFSPDTSKFLLVDRIIIKGIDKLTGTGMYPIKMEVFKSLVIENYEDPWRPDSVAEVEK